MGSQIQKSGKAVKRLQRLPPNLVHIHVQIHLGMDIYTKQIAPRDTRGGYLGFFRCQTFNSLGKLSNGCTDWHQIWYTSAASSGNGHRLNTICPTPQAAFRGGGFRGVTNSSLGKLSNGWTDWHQIQVWGSCQTAGPIGTKFGTRLRIRLVINGHLYRLNTIRPSIRQGAFLGGGGFMGSQMQVWESCQKTDWHQIWYTSVDSSGNGHLG